MWTALTVSDPSATSDSRTRAVAIAKQLGFGETDAGKVAIVVSEIATNIIKHGRGGQIFLRPLAAAEGLGLEILGIDSGPGMSDVAACVRDGHSTAGTSGTGLGAITRMSAESEIFSVRDHGTVVRALCTSRDARLSRMEPFEVGSVSLPKAGEDVCGDTVAHQATSEGLRVIVADGLGHGFYAAEASRAAVAAFQDGADLELPRLMERLHAVLRHTRGAAVGIAEIRATDGVVRFCGIGNIEAVVSHNDKDVHVMSMNGIVGHQMATARTFDYPWTRDSLLVMHSDGLTARWDLNKYPGLRARSATVIAAVLYRDARRTSDDAAVVVIRPK